MDKLQYVSEFTCTSTTLGSKNIIIIHYIYTFNDVYKMEKIQEFVLPSSSIKFLLAVLPNIVKK